MKRNFEGGEDKAKVAAQRLVEMGAELASEEDESSWVEAVKCFEKAMEICDDPVAFLFLGLAYLDGHGVRQSYEEAFKYFSRSAELGEPAAMYWISICYGKGLGVETSYDDGEMWLRRAALEGDAMAEAMYGEIEIYSGDDDLLDEGLKFLCDAAAKGEESAQKLLLRLDDDKAVVERAEDGVISSRPLAERQVARLADGMFAVACRFKAGESLGASDERVASWLSRASRDGSADAMCALSVMLMEKESSLYSPDAALDLMKKSAMRECPAAEYRMGRLYFEGELLERDDEKAREWLSKAAEDGSLDARKFLAAHFD